ncbi:MAG: hypothetical protein ACKOA8_15410, partial [Deltaproteobacteria bacterium]
MKGFKGLVCLTLFSCCSAFLQGNDQPIHNSETKHTRAVDTPKSSDPKMDAALVKLQDWVHELEARLPLESDRAVEKLLASIEK